MLMGVPIRGFADAKTRLGGVIADDRRQDLMRAVADRVVGAGRAAGCEVVVVTGAREVADWCAARLIGTIADTGAGLDGAARAIVGRAGGQPWAVVHADLPLITGDDLAIVERHLATGATVLAPSRDGGTNLLAGRGDFPFHYGLGSFVHHLAAAARRSPRVLVTRGLAVEIDTQADLTATSLLADGAWIAEFLS